MTGGTETTTKQEIERIVREVLARMLTEPVAPNGARVDIAERIVTVGTLQRRLERSSTVVVRDDAIITPAARDLLRDAGVTIERSGRPATAAQLGLRRVVGVAETRFDPSAVLAAATSGGVDYEHLARVGLIGVVDELVERVARDGAIGLLFTEAADTALCLANRHHGVRAMLARSATAVREGRRTVSANLFVIDPRGRSVFDLRQTIAATTSPAGYECGDECRTRLS